jgi:hypothetical protein
VALYLFLKGLPLYKLHFLHAEDNELEKSGVLSNSPMEGIREVAFRPSGNLNQKIQKTNSLYKQTQGTQRTIQN